MNEFISPVRLAGNVKIETFNDHTGKKVAETEGHNLITNYGLYCFKTASKILVGGQFGSNIFESEDNVSLSSPSNVGIGMVYGIALTDSAIPITSDCFKIKGNITGKAYRNYSVSTDPLVGLINLKECLFTEESIKMVFDFATDRANGTHKSVFLSDKGFDSLVYDWGYKALNKCKLQRTYTKLCYADDGYYYFSVGNTLYKLDPNSFQEIATFPLSVDPYFLDVANGKCYYSDGDALYITTLSSTNTEKRTIANTKIGRGCLIGDYLYINELNSAYIDKYNVSSAVNEYKKLSVTPTNLYKSGDSIQYTDGNGIYSYDYSSNTATKIGETVSGSSFFNSASGGTPKMNKTINSYYNGPSVNANQIICECNLAHVGANTVTGKVLDAPVVKTSDQTMKVTYTISFS